MIIYWAMYSNKAKSHDICQYLMSTGQEIAMKYNPKAPTKFAIGDIVDCNYGSHLKNEISGGHVHSIICDIDENGLVYAVPITKEQLEGDETRYLQLWSTMMPDLLVVQFFSRWEDTFIS